MITNSNNIDLSLAVWLAYDGYPYTSDPYTISATTLLKPVKEIALLHTPNIESMPNDVSNLRASRVGSAVHDSIESVWVDKAKRDKALTELGYPQRFIDNIRVNPDVHDEDYYNIYTERRTTRTLGKWTISGEFDFHAATSFEDFKNTGTYTYQKSTNDAAYTKQLSIYRWLFPHLPCESFGRIQMIFSNWSASMTFQPNYPPADMVTKIVPVWDVAQTESWIVDRLQQIEDAINNLHDQAAMPSCSRTETWQGDSEFKYYKNPKATKASKVFGTDSAGAYALLSKNGCGEVREIKPTAKYCASYCSVREICHQGQANNA